MEEHSDQRSDLERDDDLPAPAGDRRTEREDAVGTFYQQIREETGQRSAGSPLGYVVAGLFILAAGFLLLAILQGVNLHQLVIVGAVVVIVNLVVALVWTAPSFHNG